MIFIDTHCHIFNEYYDNIDKIIEKSSFNLVKYMINNASDINSCKEVISLIDKYDTMYGAIGIHPEAVNSYTPKDISYLESHLNTKKVIAIGEIGLDYFYTKENKIDQIKLFESQLKLAEKYNMPVIIHSREATLDTINILKKYKIRGTIHAFSGSIETAREYIKMGFMIGVGGVVTFKNSKLSDVIKEIGLENILLETDSPYLTPEPHRGEKNDPSHILDIAKYVALLYNISLEELSYIMINNTKKTYPKMDIK